MANLNNLTETLKNNRNLKELDKNLIVDFIGDLLELGYPTINLDNFTNNMKDFRIDTYEDVYESKISEYDKNQNRMLIHKLIVEPIDNYNITDELINKKDTVMRNYRYNVYKSLLKCASTKKENGMISTGVVDNNNNNALNEAITERFLELMLGCEYNSLDLEMITFAKIQEIVGIDSIIESYFNADYNGLKQEFEAYGINLEDLSNKMDKMMKLNRGTINPINDETLMSDIDRTLMGGYAKKIANENIDNLNIENYQSHIITPQDIQTYSKQHLNIFENTNKNLAYFEMLLKGIMDSKKEVKEY